MCTQGDQRMDKWESRFRVFVGLRISEFLVRGLDVQRRDRGRRPPRIRRRAFELVNVFNVHTTVPQFRVWRDATLPCPIIPGVANEFNRVVVRHLLARAKRLRQSGIRMFLRSIYHFVLRRHTRSVVRLTVSIPRSPT